MSRYNNILRKYAIGGAYVEGGKHLDLACNVFFEETLFGANTSKIKKHLVFTLHVPEYGCEIMFGITHSRPCDTTGVQIKITDPGLIQGGFIDKRYACDELYVFPVLNNSATIVKRNMGKISQSVIDQLLKAVSENDIFYPTIKEHVDDKYLFIYRICYLTGQKFGIKVEKEIWYGYRSLGREGKRKARKEYFDTHASFR